MRDQETAFIGKITAGVTHEFMNVLATIRETSGLMEDLLALKRETPFPHREKFEKILTVIKKQVVRGMKISGSLNRFTHSMDEPESRVEINPLLDQLAFLVQHFANLKRVQLTVEPVEPPPVIDTDPFRLQFILVACLEYCMGLTAEGGMITLQSRNIDRAIAIRIVIEAGTIHPEKSFSFPEEPSGLQEAIEDLGTQLLPISTPGQHGLELIFPLKAE